MFSVVSVYQSVHTASPCNHFPWCHWLVTHHMVPLSPYSPCSFGTPSKPCSNVFTWTLSPNIYWQEHGCPSHEMHFETFIVTFEPWLWVGDVRSNLTSLYDVCTTLSQQVANMTKNFEVVTKELEETKKKLNAIEEKLKTGNAEGN